jgi:virginiamycin B lyase
VEPIEGRLLLTATVHAFPLPTANDWPTFIAAGPDGNVWLTEAPHVYIGVDYITPPDRSGPIAKVAPDGTVTEFPLPAHVIPGPLTAGPDGTVWFTETLQDKGNFTFLGIDRITTDGVVSPVPNTSGLGDVTAMATAPDGAVWVVAGSSIDRIAAGGSVTTFPVGKADGQALAVGADGTVWFSESAGVTGAIGRLTPATGAVASFSLPSSGVLAESLAVGSDGNAWFTESVVGSGGVSRIGRVTPGGAVTEFPLDVANSFATGITAGPDGALYFVENSPGIPPGYLNPINAIGRVTTDGSVSDAPLTGFGGVTGKTTVGPDGNLWFGEFNVGAVGKLVLSQTGFSSPTPTPTPSPTPTPPRVIGVNAAPATARGPVDQVVLTFNASLATAPAGDPGNYSLVEMGRPGQHGLRHATHVRIASVAYDEATRTVTLHVRGSLQAGRTYQLTLNTTPPQGVTGADGVALAGSAVLRFSRPRVRNQP